MTVVGGASGAKINVPPPTPGPASRRPGDQRKTDRQAQALAGIVLPLVKVILALMWISRPAHSAILPSVVVIAKNTFTSWPALSRMLPLVVVMGALTFTSRPQQATMLPLVARDRALMFTSRNAFSVKVVGVPDAVHATASLTRMSPLPPVLSPVDAERADRDAVSSPAAAIAWLPEMLPPAPTDEVGGVDQPGPGGAERRGGGDLGCRRRPRRVAADVSIEAAVAATRRAGVEHARDTIIVPLCMSPSSGDRAVAVLSSVRASIDAAVVDHGSQQRPRPPGRSSAPRPPSGAQQRRRFERAR